GGDRSRWTMALAPLLQPLTAAAPVAGAAGAGVAAAVKGSAGPGVSADGLGSAGASLAVAAAGTAPVRLVPLAIGVLLAASATLAAVVLWPRANRHGGDEGRAVEPTAVERPAARLNPGALRRLPPVVRAAAPPTAAGPEGLVSTEADRIVRQMLGAITAGSYDEFL